MLDHFKFFLTWHLLSRMTMKKWKSSCISDRYDTWWLILFQLGMKVSMCQSFISGLLNLYWRKFYCDLYFYIIYEKLANFSSSPLHKLKSGGEIWLPSLLTRLLLCIIDLVIQLFLSLISVTIWDWSIFCAAYIDDDYPILSNENWG